VRDRHASAFGLGTEAQSGVAELIVDMPTYDSRDRKDVMLRQIREVIAEENRKHIIERLWKGRQERARRGLRPRGNLCYGYERAGRDIAIKPSEALIVRLIFAGAAGGSCGSAIAIALNAKGLVRRNGKAMDAAADCIYARTPRVLR